MVRLERALYEKLVNTRTLGRAREIAKPRYFKKTLDVNRSYFWPAGGTATSLYFKFCEKWFAFQYRFDLSYFKPRAYSLIEFKIFPENEWRRSSLNEQLHRENVHPYHFFQRQMTRQRYHKLEKYVSGVEMPEEAIDEVYGTPEIEKQDHKHSYHKLHEQYVRELMPNTYMWRAVRWAVLDIFLIHNILSRDMWNRLFYNEQSHVQELDDLEESIDSRKKEAKILVDYSKPENRANFITYLDAKIAAYPSYYTVEGVPFDYESFFKAMEMFQKGEAPKDAAMKREFSKIMNMFDFKRGHDAFFKSQNNEWLHNDAAEEDIQDIANSVGIKMPERTASPKYRAWMA